MCKAGVNQWGAIAKESKALSTKEGWKRKKVRTSTGMHDILQSFVPFILL